MDKRIEGEIIRQLEEIILKKDLIIMKLEKLLEEKEMIIEELKKKGESPEWLKYIKGTG